MSRIPIIIAAGALFLGGCATAPKAYTRVDGLPIAPERLEADTLGCKGRVATAASQGGGQETMDRLFLPADRTDRAIFSGCMADKGYLPSRE